ncbi:MAG: metallophosphoesterase [Firmicutes bacterium]|nr:metallophosphoesterase [Bacillota bacterium]
MAIFAIGDLHLAIDERIEKPMDVFGPVWADHDKRVSENWHRLITDEDLVIVCGDISWGLRFEEAQADLDFVAELPGQKVLIKGNHDLWWTSISKLQAYDRRMFFVQNNTFRWGDMAICGTRGWICPGTEGFEEHDQKIYDRELIRLRMSLEAGRASGAENLICALHYPPSNDKFQPSGFTALLEEYDVRTCVYGHLHGKEVFRKGYKGNWNGVEYKLVSLDYVNAEPVRIG